MGSRAHYVTLQDGTFGLYYSQWGAYHLELDLLPGPGPATRFARSQREESSWMWEPECDGACLIDHDERRLLFFSGCDGDPSYRLAALATLARTWPGWRVEWAFGGLRQIKVAAGHAAEVTMPYSRAPETGEAWCDVLVTMIHHGRTRAYLVDSAEAVICEGARSLDDYRSAWSAITSCPEKVVAGVHLDLDDQTAGVWTSSTLGGVLLDVGRWWPGWHWSNWEDRSAEQARRVAGALTMPEPDLAAGLRVLAAEFDRHQDVDFATRSASILLGLTDLLSAGARMPGRQVSVHADNSFAHRPMDLTSDEKALVHAAIAGVMTSP
ncbi:hypothetical protein [Nonomuraea zeae]|uniref:Uncharacterized protein n=1 Tax=Nonomuraea zeae TaxID=1642303 RepID=A0A5S4GAM2_9ACTN|nr:hypothetical protein [Nonomuraea zeae]TMR23050.1 hypothetical protein ETD85_48570 [Nonomuraea zeae]